MTNVYPGSTLRDYPVQVKHPYFSTRLNLAEITSDHIKMHCQDTIDSTESNFESESTRFFFEKDIEVNIKTDIVDCVRTDNNESIVIARFSEPEDEDEFWSTLRQQVLPEDTPLAPGARPRLPARALFTETARRQREAFLQDYTGVNLDCITSSSVDPESLPSVTESFIGTVEVPIGAAGPLLFNGKHAQGHIFAPMATTEGSLVASATRGATAVTVSGGMTTAFLNRRITRVPLFQLANLNEALFVSQWIQSHFADINSQTQLMSSHAKLLSIEPQVVGRDLHLHFVYDSADAAGQNMVTGCTWRACHWIMDKLDRKLGLKVKRFIIESNLSNDKKVTFNNFIYGRGTRAVAECTVSGEVMKRILHVTPEQLVRGYHSLAAGGVAGGMIGININIANMVAAVFTSTGQDIGSVHESGVGHLTLELVNNGNAVYASLVMPSLLIGTVGGGTRLPQQNRCLQMIGCEGAGKSPRLAEVICGYALALDLSTLSALVSDEFAAAHHPLAKEGYADMEV
ncbi:hydroxymethylglutaryl-CoA reductase [Exilibacterium tricleocarpae]|uniref:hydroxymethylglutaryl-CoA reductase (NADPH) n=1 Tax=Exilibacterium tricleocarpae TaxID=2591008 RepID=A0A545U474_9GAMM|nr:hydroxymethylglutaryl-CoA reductase [Exilibacterium tricleocarpae]TQV84291.1 hydroxymethylglutaryl-CoA reductase [Exilibacterium tricleocarpae]